MDLFSYLEQELFIGNLLSNFRDLKPDNVFIHKGILKIADFGLSKRLSNRKAKNISLVGTPLYMSL